ncbi:MAG: hypothetical protein K2X86_15350 [Cytophagaceae bacterium]|nr:hypothetical protein [Cytophagaceae bacterium]
MEKSTIFKSIKTLSLVIVAIGFMAVKCKRPESVGPSYKIAPEGFTVSSYTVGNPTVNFSVPANNKDTFYAAFSHEVSWSIILTGRQSGAVKTITGTSQTIDGSNPAWLWDGSHDGLYFFIKNEVVDAKITFLGSNLEYTDSVTVTGTKVFKDIVVTDFETTAGFISYNDAPGGDNPSSAATITDGATMADGEIFKKSVQGIKSFYWYSNDGGPRPNFFGGGGARSVTTFRAQFPNDPDSLYLNVYIYGKGDPNSRLNFGAREDDNDTDVDVGPPLVNYNATTHAPKSDDEFQVQITLDHVGWKLFSFKYSDLTPSASKDNGGNGNGVKEPKRITDITFGLISSPKGNFVEAIVDFPVITFGGPFDPRK